MNGGPSSVARALASQERLTFKNAAVSSGSSSTSSNSVVSAMMKLPFKKPLSHARHVLRSDIATSEALIRRMEGVEFQMAKKIRVVLKLAAQYVAYFACLDCRHGERSE